MDQLIFEKDALDAERTVKRGVKPNEEYLTIAVDNLENLFIEYQGHGYYRNADALYKKERARRRNEISALESRIKKRLGEQ